MPTDSAPTPAVATPEETTAFRTAQEKEWHTYVATQPISFNGVNAYNVGDPVPASNVEARGYEAQGVVAKVTTKAGAQVVADLQRAASDEPTAEVVPPVSLAAVVPGK